MGLRRIVAGAAVAATALAVAGCGGSNGAASSGLGGAASIAPSDAVAFVAVDSDVSSGQWSTVDGLLKKFPARDELIAKLTTTFQQRSKLNWNEDVKPALGSELDLIALPCKEPQLVGLTQPADKSKLAALLQKLDKNVATVQVGDWTAFSTSQAALEHVQSASTKLADNNTYRAAIGKLAGDALVRAYANGTEAQQLLSSLGKQDPSATQVPFAWASADVVASGDGVRVSGYSHDGTWRGVLPRDQHAPTPPYTSGLVDEIPSGVLLVADFQVVPGQFEFSPADSLPKPLQKFFSGAPSFLSEIDDVLGGETAVYVRPGLPIPEVTIVTQPNDVSRAQASLDDLLKALRASAGTAKGPFDLSSIPVFHRAQGGQLIISTSQQGIADFSSAGAKLSADPSFLGAQKAAAMPAQTTGFLYVNLASSLPIVQALGPMLGLTLPKGDVSALKTFTAFGTRDGEEAGFSAFLQVG